LAVVNANRCKPIRILNVTERAVEECERLVTRFLMNGTKPACHGRLG